MTPREFFEQVVEPTLAEFKSCEDDLRRAILAIWVVDALAAHVHFHMVAKLAADDLGFRNHLAQQSDEFRLLRDAAKALKHAKLERGAPLVSGSDQVGIRPVGYGAGGYGEGPYGGRSQMVIEYSDGRKRNLQAVLKASIAILRSHADL
jgi:hypothetical protein